MELKLVIGKMVLVSRFRSNRTFMELKCLAAEDHCTKVGCSNRTFMELK